jgi:hypothetical protein
MLNIPKRLIKFLSSVKLAVPLMLVIIGVIAYGTIVESNYNADMAKIKVYQTRWFNGLMILLWLNIFFAALSRWPWKLRHFGFLVTHLGLLTLLAGGMITGLYGTDGTLRVMENEESSIVVLPDLVFGIAPAQSPTFSYYPIRRSDHPQHAAQFSDINQVLSTILKIEQYLPFTESKTSLASSAQRGDGPLAIEFNIKSQFFDVNQTLDTTTQQSVTMGPALFVLRETKPLENSGKKLTLSQSPDQRVQADARWLIVKDKTTGTELKRVPITAKQIGATISVNKVAIKVTQIFQKATVGPKGLEENSEGASNPALEINISQGEVTARDVIFTKYPGFSLNQKNDFNLSFEYQAKLLQDTSIIQRDPSTQASGSSNQVAFEFDRKNPEQVKLILAKNGEQVLNQVANLNEAISTPWMGIQVTLKGVYWNPEKKLEVRPLVPPLKEPFLPPSALLITPALSAPSDQTWLVEGEERSLYANDRNYTVYYGRKIEQLPFKIKLGSFRKIDYPGTTMAKSFESTVKVSDITLEQTISMNEPLEHQGYTVYQSSYEELPGGHYASIFSINRDPGRQLKYWGSLILCLGIIIFTLMRSRWYQRVIAAKATQRTTQ